LPLIVMPDIDIQISEVSWILWRTTINQGHNILFVLHLRGFIGQGNRGDRCLSVSCRDFGDKSLNSKFLLDKSRFKQFLEPQSAGIVLRFRRRSGQVCRKVSHGDLGAACRPICKDIWIPHLQSTTILSNSFSRFASPNIMCIA
jgi:hypothetical protein